MEGLASRFSQQRPALVRIVPTLVALSRLPQNVSVGLMSTQLYRINRSSNKKRGMPGHY